MKQSLLYVILCAFALACDKGEEEVVGERMQATILASENGLGFLSLNSIYGDDKFYIMQVLEKPTAGNVSRVSNIIRYYPTTGASVDDKFLVKLSGKEAPIFLECTVVPNTVDKCEKDPVTNLSVAPGTLIGLEITNAKQFCGSSGLAVGTCVLEQTETDPDLAAAHFLFYRDNDQPRLLYTFFSAPDFVGEHSMSYVAGIGSTVGSNSCDASTWDYGLESEITVEVKK